MRGAVQPALSGRLAGVAVLLAGALWVLAAAGDAALRAGVLRGEAWPGLTLLPFVVSLLPLALAGMLALRHFWHDGALARVDDDERLAKLRLVVREICYFEAPRSHGPQRRHPRRRLT